MEKNADYVQVSELARKFQISSHTIRRRVDEGKIFPGAKKVQMGFGELWLIPRAVAEAVTLQDISPKIYQERYKNKITPVISEMKNMSSYLKSISALEERVSVLEQLLLKRSI